jgi:hypothetical protein
MGGVERDAQGKGCEYVEHFPVGTPPDDIAEGIPPKIGSDLKEALRCRWVDANNATAEMCRRAIQTSCLDLGASASDNVTSQIDWIHGQGKITTFLKEVAHKIRLGGNRAAHPNDAEDPISPEEADAILAFTKHYLDHVYVVPKQMERFDFTRSGRRPEGVS